MNDVEGLLAAGAVLPPGAGGGGERVVPLAAGEVGFHTRTVLTTEHAAISHASLEYKVDQLSSTTPGYPVEQIQYFHRAGWMGAGGAVAMTRGKDGTVIYTLLIDVDIADVTLRWVGCEHPGPDFAGAVQAYLDAAPRTAEPGFRLRAVGATDATSPNADAVTASWDLTPCPDPVAGPVTAGCAG